MSGLCVDFAGEVVRREPGGRLVVGRAGDLAIDDNPYLHREFLAFEWSDALWWVCNIGSRLAAYLTDEQGTMRSTLSPGSRLPLVFPTTMVTFACGETLYELVASVPQGIYEPQRTAHSRDGDTTVTPGHFTESQLLALLALAEPVLRRAGSGAGSIPASSTAAARLGWSVKRFDKKVENICDKLTAAGVRGLTGQTSRVASNRRLHLVEYATSTLLVTPADLALLDLPRTPAAAPEEDDA